MFTGHVRGTDVHHVCSTSFFFEHVQWCKVVCSMRSRALRKSPTVFSPTITPLFHLRLTLLQREIQETILLVPN